MHSHARNVAFSRAGDPLANTTRSPQAYAAVIPQANSYCELSSISKFVSLSLIEHQGRADGEGSTKTVDDSESEAEEQAYRRRIGSNNALLGTVKLLQSPV